MPSHYTPNFNLSQWEKTDKVQMEDFNTDNAKLDAALAEKADKASIPNIVTGTYVGDGEPTQVISLGFTPKAVFVCDSIGQTVCRGGSDTIYGYCGGLALPGFPAHCVSVVDGGFSVNFQGSHRPYQYTNLIDASYRYVAFA